MASVRSPNYPQRSLEDAVKLVEAIYASEKTHPASDDALAQAIGYTSLNGSSRSALAALKRYGLLEKTSDGLHKLSITAMRIMFPVEENDRANSLIRAFTTPSVFQQMSQRYSNDPPSDTTMRNFLMSVGFVDTGAQEVVDMYKESLKYLKSENILLEGKDKVNLDSNKVIPDDNVEIENIIEDPAENFTDLKMLPSLERSTSQTIVEDMVFKISKNATAYVRFSGEYSKKSIDRLINHLEITKLAFDED